MAGAFMRFAGSTFTSHSCFLGSGAEDEEVSDFQNQRVISYNVQYVCIYTYIITMYKYIYIYHTL